MSVEEGGVWKDERRERLCQFCVYECLVMKLYGHNHNTVAIQQSLQ